MADRALKVGIIIGSTRVVRVGPQVAKFLLDTFKTAGPDASAPSPDLELQSRTQIDLIDLKDYNLPIFDEPVIPNRVFKPEGYANEHTRVWSRKIASYDAFVFLSAQRNWGIPAELKNSIDYLFNEWKGKPAMIVSFGGHGGEQAADQIKTVLGAIGMRVVPRIVSMAFPSRDALTKAFAGEDLGLDATNDEGPWAEHRATLRDVFWDDTIAKTLVPTLGLTAEGLGTWKEEK
ncbi:NAD(P)H-dependent FMN reductase LOT6 [Cytospora mali]|uniref:NAD(P)H-dependent FMN reductase LOT6 n=1 Tax=Cytospora mali TaxID=578113 RepID=A0A194VKK7_CYTMA|nr:NAD(P)H-dependent FMN reductase LOT6 [Valsa mali]